MKPIEDLVLKAGVMLIKCLLGMVAADPRKSAKKLLAELDGVMIAMSHGDDGLTPEKGH